ncbi:MAG: cytochrome c oxidase subunit 3 [bacterium]|nr:cytochrome c oxidase subunit 3 [bacterium]
MAQNVSEQGLSRDELIALKNKRSGVFIFQLSWILVFICLIVVNLQIRSNFPSWPPPGVRDLDVVLPTLATIALIISGVLARRGLTAIRDGQTAGFFPSWQGAMGLGAAFLLVMAYEFLAVEISGQYSTIFRVMTAFHAVHALVIGVILWNVYQNARAGAYDAVRYWGVEAAAKMWYFVVVAWIMFYTVLYLV